MGEALLEYVGEWVRVEALEDINLDTGYIMLVSNLGAIDATVDNSCLTLENHS